MHAASPSLPASTSAGAGAAAVLQMVLCKHRMGMICAAGRDHKAATALLTSSKEHYQKQQQDHPLALEADLGLTMAQ
jgi:hypothetical protein